MDLKQAKFTQVVNNVEVVSAADKSSRNASVNDTFKMPDLLRTGPSSRAELTATDGTITRVGANTVFSYDEENRTIDLQQGSLLFHSPHGEGGGTIRTGAATASVLGTTIIVTCTPDGGFKLLDLEGETEVRFLNGLKQHLEPGQMTFILPGGTQPSPIIIFRLDTQSKGSLLLNGFDNPLPSISRIDAEVTRQLLEILNNHVGDTGLLVGNNATANSVQVFQDFQTINAEIHQQVLHNNNLVNGNMSISDSDINAAGDVTIIADSSPVDIIPDNGNVGITAGGLVTIADTTIIATGKKTVDITAGTGISVGSTSISTDPEAGTISLNNASGVTTINKGSSMQAFYISVNSPDGILLDATGGTYSGNQLDLTSGNAAGTEEIKVLNADLTAFATINMTAHTITLTDVAFGGASTVNLNSFSGMLAPMPNTGALSLPGFVNFISGVTYGGTTITTLNEATYVKAGNGAGIHISTLP
jgi:hypothetical protein